MKKYLFFLLLSWMALPLFAQNNRRDLFNYVENPSLSPHQQHFLQVIARNPVNVAYRFVTVNHELFASAGPLTLNLDGLATAGRSEISIREVALERRGDQEYSWRGSVDGWPLAGVNFVFDQGFIHGNISTSDGLYGVEPIGEGLHVLIKMSPAKFQEEGCKHIEKDKGETPAAGEARKNRAGAEKEAAVGDCRIRLLVAFTDDVFAAHANPRGEIQLATDNFNTANQNSNVEHRVELARIMQVNYAESGDDDTDLPLFRNNGDGVMDAVHAARDLYDADLCCLIVDSLDACGLASGIGSSYATAFQVCAFGCAAGNLSFAHEFGHLLNARHDTFVDNTAGTNHAFVNRGSAWRTVMAYNDECDCSDEVVPCPAAASRATPGMPTCTRVQWWSNPSVNFSGTPTGISTRCDNRTALDGADNGVITFEGLVVNKILTVAETVAQQEEGNLLAEQTIENTAGVAVQYLNDAKGSYRAGTSVTLRPGFWAQNGADFRAFIDACADNLSLQASVEDREGPAFETGSDLRISPNPVADFASLDYTLPVPTTLSISLLDNMGTTLQTIVAGARQEAGSYHLETDLGDLPGGVYYLRYADSQGSKVVPVVKIGL